MWVEGTRARDSNFSRAVQGETLRIGRATGASCPVSIREAGKVRGTRLFHLASILNFLEALAEIQAPGGELSNRPPAGLVHASGTTARRVALCDFQGLAPRACGLVRPLQATAADSPRIHRAAG